MKAKLEPTEKTWPKFKVHPRHPVSIFINIFISDSYMVSSVTSSQEIYYPYRGMSFLPVAFTISMYLSLCNLPNHCSSYLQIANIIRPFSSQVAKPGPIIKTDLEAFNRPTFMTFLG
jgi:hypothetical protein